MPEYASAIRARSTEAESDMRVSRSHFLFTFPFVIVHKADVSRFRVQLSDPDFCAVLSGAGLGEGALSIAVFTMDVFQRLREELFEKLLPKLTVGDHAILLQLWDTKPSVSQELEVC